MADLNFKAQIELLDKMTAPMRSISSQAQRLGRQFGDTAKQAKKLQSQQRLIDSFKQQKHALAETSEQAQRSRMRLADLQRQMDATTAPSRTLVRQFEAAGRESQRLNTRLDSQRQHLQQLRGRLSDAGIDTRRLSDHERELARQIERTNQQLGEQRRRLGEVRRLQQQSQQMRDMRGKSAGLAVGGAAAIYGGSRLIQPGLEFEAEMSRVQAITRLDKNSPQYKMLEAQARQLGATTAFTQANAAQGQKFLAMAGFTPESIRAAMPGMLDLALAGDMDLASTADIASNILSGMNLETSKMTDVADVLTAAFTRANVDVGMLGETMKYAAPGAAGLNISLQEVAAMAGKLGDAGMQGSMGGTALRAIMLRMAAPPKAAAAALDRLGISTTDASGNLRAMPDILKDVYEQTRNLGNTEQLDIFSKISGVEASNAMKVLVDQAGNGELQKMVTTLQAADSEAANVARTMSDNTMGDWKETTSAIDAFRTALFDTNGGALRDFLQSMTKIIQRMTEFANANPQLMAVLGKLFAMLAIGAVVIGGIGVVMLSILGPMALLRASLVTLGLPSTLTPLSMLGKAFGMVSGAVKALTMTLMANPLLALVLALAVLAYTVYKNWDTLGPMFANLWNKIAAGAQALWARITAIWAAIKQGVINYANQLWSGLGIKFNSGIAALVGIILAFTPVGLFIRAFAAVWPYLSSLGAKFKQYGINMLNGLKDGILGKAQAVINSISSVVNRVKGAFTGSKGMDIHSPSRVFTKYGGFMMHGLADGITGLAKMPFKAFGKVTRYFANHSPINLDTFTGAGRYIKRTGNSNSGIVTQPPINLDRRRSILPNSATMRSGGSGAMSMGNITININGGADPYTTAQMVRAEMERIQRDTAARHRSRLSDID
jgi:TP901 family phage tail tape measure protein